MKYANSEMISTYDGKTEGARHRCTVVLREEAIVVEYFEDDVRTTYSGVMKTTGHYVLCLEAENYIYTATLNRIDEDLLKGHWQERYNGATNSGTWSIELAQ